MITVKVMCIMILIGSEDDPPSFKRRLKIYPLSIVLIFFTTIGFIYVGRLVIMYTYLLAKDETYK